MPALVLVRHGQTDRNSRGMFTGTINAVLTEKGKMQAKAVGEHLRGLFQFKLVYTSDMIRTIHTADLMKEQGAFGDVPRLATAAIGPRSYGDLQGRRREDLKLEYSPDELLQFKRGWDIAPPNGDAFKVVVERAGEFWKSYLELHLAMGEDSMGRSDILLVSHGNFIAALTMVIEKMPPEKSLKLQPKHDEIKIYRFETNFGMQKDCDQIELLKLTGYEERKVYIPQPEQYLVLMTA